MTCVPFVLAAIAAGQADARSRYEQCAGILHQDTQKLWFGGAPGEDEGICIVAAAQAQKVLAVCAAGAYCRVIGVIADCEGSGECAEIKRVVSASRRKTPPPR